MNLKNTFQTVIPSLLAAFLVLAISCQAPTPNQSQLAMQVIDEVQLGQHIITLSSDDFQGRMPFTEGEEKTVDYMINSFKDMGVEPGNGLSFEQEVPLVEIDAIPEGEMTFTFDGGFRILAYLDEFVALTRRVQERVEVMDSEMVFAGYGIVAPEYDWNDYQDLDVAGKTVVVMVNDPGYGSDDESFFKGNTMTYYGRWTYKYEEAARQGAEAILIIHDDGPAGYPWEVVRGGWSGPNQYLKAEDNNMSRCAVEGWIPLSVAKELMANTGIDESIIEQAKTPEFKAVPLNSTMSVTLNSTFREDVSRNVIGVVPGSERPDEIIIYSAHWDHLGVGEPIDGDSIYNGAEDNASGVACLLEIAQAFMEEGARPQRSVGFLMVTAEEQGLLGSGYYAANPIYAPEKTVANLNIDALGSYGATKDVIVIGYGQSELEDYAEEMAAAQDRYIVPDQEPEKGYFFRSDHFNFAKIGIPALYAEGGLDSREHGKDWGKEQKNAYTANRYHKPSDQYNEQTWDLTGMVQDAQLFYMIGNKLANEDAFPQWKAGSEFKSIRDSYMNP